MRPETILPLLVTANLVFDARRSPDELLLLADVFAEALSDCGEAETCKAFALQLKRGRRFPVPSEILDLLCECRPIPQALPEAAGAITPGYGAALARQWLAKNSGGGVCARAMDSLRAEALAQSPQGGCRAPMAGDGLRIAQ